MLSERLPIIATGVFVRNGASTTEWSQTMGLNREDKATVIAEISEVVSNSSAMVIAEYRGLTVQAVTKLRAEARKNGVTVRVVKNTLVRRAVEGTGFAGLADQFTGPLVYGFSADPVAVAKVLVNFAKDKLDLGSVPGHAYIDGSNLLLVFPVTKLIDMVKAMGSKISSMETIVALLENYKNVYIGFEFSRQAGENAK